MRKTSKSLYVSYNQICVFSSNLENPYNDWSDRNFSQGFAWRPESSSFRTICDDVAHKIKVIVNEDLSELNSRCIRAIRVPIRLNEGSLDVASISGGFSMNVEPGQYALQIEFYGDSEATDHDVVIRLNRGNSDFAILRADLQLVADGELDLEARPAIWIDYGDISGLYPLGDTTQLGTVDYLIDRR